MTKRLAPFLLVAALLAATLGGAFADAASTPTTLRLDGIGPLKLGMSRTAALKTGWLAHRGKGCELQGPSLPVTYTFTGAKAPKGLEGTVQFTGDKLDNVAISKGASTAAGVTIGTSTKTMVARYKAEGMTVKSSFETTFGGTFVTVERKGNLVLGAFAEKGKAISVLGLPFVGVCE